MWVWFNVDFRFAPSHVIQVVGDALCSSSIDNVADDPRPQVVCMDFSKDAKESFSSYAVRYWIQDLTSDDSTSSRVRCRIYAALQRARIPLAVPAHTAFVELKDEARTAKRTERQAKERFAALKTVHLFRTLTDDELHTLAAGMSHVMYADGEVITRQGRVAHWLYVMTAGTTEIRARVERSGGNGQPGADIRIARLTAPDFFGEMSLMTGEPRSADVIAVGDVDCFRLGKDTFKTVLLARPEIATELSAKLAARRVELIAARGEVDAGSMPEREASERERILGAIKSFFALS
jgi:CRP-like cAMP-binding protein